MARNDPSHGTRHAGPLVAFRYASYRLFWIGNAFSNIGIWALMAGRLWLMHELTDSPLMLGLVTFAGLGPILLLSMWGGVVADRVNRMRLVVITRALFAFTAILTGVLAATGINRAMAAHSDLPCERRPAVVRHSLPPGHHSESGAAPASDECSRASVSPDVRLHGDRAVPLRPAGQRARNRGRVLLRRRDVRRHGRHVRARRSSAAHRRSQADDAVDRPHGRLRIHTG